MSISLDNSNDIVYYLLRQKKSVDSKANAQLKSEWPRIEASKPLKKRIHQ